MQDQKTLLVTAEKFGVDIATARNENKPNDQLRRDWNNFIDEHPHPVQIVLRDKFYEAYYATRDFMKENG